MRGLSRLTVGYILKGEPCPSRNLCEISKSGECGHKGINHPCDFSCAAVREFDNYYRDIPLPKA